MANSEHLHMLQQGVEVWNQWRTTIPRQKPDLSEVILPETSLTPNLLMRVDLRGVDLAGAALTRAVLRRSRLTGASLSGADLTGADLIEADLAQADLRRTDLRGADLTGADLAGADLRESNLSDANLSSANLTEANLARANLEWANLSGTILTRSILDETNFHRIRLNQTIFANVDLSQARGLESVQHLGPSTIDIDTLYRHSDSIPQAFLRGCGVHDSLIEYLPALIGALEPIQFYSCFISYSSNDEAFARRLHSRMRDEHLRVWFAPEDIQAGKKIYEQLEEAIRIYDKLLVVLSEHSLQSDWVMTEIRKAREAELRQNQRKLFPIRLTDMQAIKAWRCFDSDTGRDLAVEVREYHIPDFSNWKDHDAFEVGFARLLRDLRAAERSSPSLPAQ